MICSYLNYGYVTGGSHNYTCVHAHNLVVRLFIPGPGLLLSALSTDLLEIVYAGMPSLPLLVIFASTRCTGPGLHNYNSVKWVY